MCTDMHVIIMSAIIIFLLLLTFLNIKEIVTLKTVCNKRLRKLYAI